jgi:triacylglycerol lipase
MRKLSSAWRRQSARIAAVICCVLSLTYANSAQQHTEQFSNGERVVLLHGLARSASSMTKLAETLQAKGFAVCNVDYPSRDYPIATLASGFIKPAIERCFGKNTGKLNFVTHSLGGIIVRVLAEQDAAAIGRVVMLSPPNHGSEVVDKLGDVWGFDWLNGPAGQQLGTGEQSLPLKLGPATFEVGVITGVRSINPVLSTLIPGDDDGKVGVNHARLDGMRDFLVLRCSHPFIMKSDRAIEQTLNFLKHGAFKHAPLALTAHASPGSEITPEDCWD